MRSHYHLIALLAVYDCAIKDVMVLFRNYNWKEQNVGLEIWFYKIMYKTGMLEIDFCTFLYKTAEENFDQCKFRKPFSGM